MEKLDCDFIKAVREGNIKVVQDLLDKGAKVNIVPPSETTPLCTAALSGNIAIMKILLDFGKHTNNSFSQKDYFCYYDEKQRIKTQCESSRSHPTDCDKRQTNNIDTKANLGYFIFVHDDVNSDSEFSIDHPMDVNQNTNLLQNDPLTPDGMDGLEWDTEVNECDEKYCETDDDIWSSQYRWYANILDKTSYALMDQPNTCDINLQDLDGRCALHCASDQGHFEAALLLINSGCRVDVSDCQNLTPLHLAASRDHVDIVKLLLSHGAQVNRKTVDKLVPLHFAAVRGFIDTVKVLLNAGAHVDAIDSSEQTALHLVICRGHVDVAELLIQHGAKVNIEEIHGYTPLCEAVWQKSVPLVRLLLSAGAKITQSHYLLHYAVLHQHYEMVKLLLDAGSIPNLRDHETGDTPLILAAKTGQSHIADLLLKNGASPNYVNSLTGLTPLHVVVRIRESDFASVCTFINVLCRHNVNLNATVSTSGETPLSMALINKRYRAAVFLIKLGADVNINSKMVPNLAIAWNHNNFPIVRLLVAAGLDMRQRFPEINRPDDFSQLNTETITGWLKYRKFNPPPMSDLCRICVRQYLGDKVSDIVPTLDLPKILQKYLMFEDIYVEDLKINTRISCGDSGLFSKYL